MIEPVIRAALGAGVTRFEYTCAGIPRTGWVLRLRQDEATFRSDAWRVVDDHWRALSARDVRLFVGPGVFEVAPGRFAEGFEIDPDAAPVRPPAFDQVFALPGLPVLDVIEFARVGSRDVHPAGDG